LEISFETRQLREFCENEAEGNRQLGDAVAKSLRSRLADCESSSSVAELIAGRPRELGDATMSLELEGGSFLVFTVNHETIPATSDGHVDWGKVYSIRVLKIEAKNERS
jgi:hypothetical protein